MNCLVICSLNRAMIGVRSVKRLFVKVLFASLLCVGRT